MVCMKQNHPLLISRGNKPRKGKVLICPSCQKEFYRQISTIKNGACCSYKCYGIKQRKRISLTCKECKKKYEVAKSIHKWKKIRGETKTFCSITCYKMYKKTKSYQKKRKSKTEGSVLKKELWIIFSKYIRQRDEGKCISCGKSDYWRNMDAGHYIPKTAGLAIYFDERNVNCQCTYCNRWMHGNLSQYALALQKKYGNSILEELDIKRRNLTKISVLEYRQMIEIYKNKLLDFEQ